MHLEFMTDHRLDVQYLADLNALWKVVSGHGEPPITEDDMERMFSGGSPSRLFTCMDKNTGRLVGHVWVTIKRTSSPSTAFIDELVVLTEYRRMGIAEHLMTMAEDYAWGKGVRRMELTSSDHREEAIAFYLKHGYHIRDTNVMGKHLEENR
jgi:ribosomal protein S18 acetylase RimI-like enzyme